MPRLKLNPKKLRRYLLLGGLCYILFVFISLPASVLARQIFTRLNATQSLRLQNVHGTLWRGEALAANYGRINLGKLDWNMNVFGLLLGNLDLDLHFGQQTTQGHGGVALGFGGKLRMDDVDLRLPASDLAPLFGGYPVNFSGNLQAKIQQLEVKPGSMFKGKGRMVWQQAVLLAPHNIDLGDILIELEPQNTNTKITISDQGEKGQLKVDLKLEIQASGKYRWEGTLKPRGADDEKLIEFLRFIGRPDSNNNYWVSRSGQLAGW
jgi:general secretion pathway protein N